MGDASSVRLAIAEETTFGTPEPSGAGIYKYLRFNNESLRLDIGNVQSRQIDPTRQPSANIRVNRNASGDITCEDSLVPPAASSPINTITGFDALIEGALMNDFSPIISVTGADITIGTPAAGVFTLTDDLSAGAFTGVAVGDWLRLSAFAVNGTIYCQVTVVSTVNLVTATGVRSTGAAVTAETDTTVNIAGSTCKIGTTKKSYTIERAYTDLAIDEYSLYTGMRVARWAMRLNAQAIFEHTFGFLGQLQATTIYSVAGTPTNVWSQPILQAVDHFKMKMIDSFGVVSTERISEISFELNNNPRTEPELGALGGSTGIGISTPTLSGTIRAYMTDAALVRIAEVGQRSKVAFRLDDGTRARIISINSILFGTPEIGAQGNDQSVIVTLPFSAESDANGIALTVSRF